MAYCDYMHCDVCDCKVYYDSEVDYEYNTGDIGVLCKECAKTYEVIIKEKQIGA